NDPLLNYYRVVMTAGSNTVQITDPTGQISYPEADFGNFQPIYLPDGNDSMYSNKGNDIIYGDNQVSDPRVITKGPDDDTIGGGLDNNYIDGQDGTNTVIQSVDANQTLTSYASTTVGSVATFTGPFFAALSSLPTNASLTATGAQSVIE